MTSELPARIVTAVRDRFLRDANLFEAFMLLEDDRRAAIDADLDGIAQQAIAEGARAARFVAEFLTWWHQAGRHFYGWGAEYEDEGLANFACDAVQAVGGWRAARRALRSQGPAAPEPHS